MFRDLPSRSVRSTKNRPCNLAQNVAKRVVNEMTGVPYSKINARLPAYQIVYDAIREAQLSVGATP